MVVAVLAVDADVVVPVVVTDVLVVVRVAAVVLTMTHREIRISILYFHVHPLAHIFLINADVPVDTLPDHQCRTEDHLLTNRQPV